MVQLFRLDMLWWMKVSFAGLGQMVWMVPQLGEMARGLLIFLDEACWMKLGMESVVASSIIE